MPTEIKRIFNLSVQELKTLTEAGGRRGIDMKYKRE